VVIFPDYFEYLYRGFTSFVNPLFLFYSFKLPALFLFHNSPFFVEKTAQIKHPFQGFSTLISVSLAALKKYYGSN